MSQVVTVEVEASRGEALMIGARANRRAKISRGLDKSRRVEDYANGLARIGEAVEVIEVAVRRRVERSFPTVDSAEVVAIVVDKLATYLGEAVEVAPTVAEIVAEMIEDGMALSPTVEAVAEVEYRRRGRGVIKRAEVIALLAHYRDRGLGCDAIECADCVEAVKRVSGLARREAMRVAQRISTGRGSREYVEGFQRQEASPNYSPMIGEDGEVDSPVGGPRPVANRAPGVPHRDAFKRDGHLDIAMMRIAPQVHVAVCEASEHRNYSTNVNWSQVCASLGTKWRSTREAIEAIYRYAMSVEVSHTGRVEAVATGRVTDRGEVDYSGRDGYRGDPVYLIVNADHWSRSRRGEVEAVEVEAISASQFICQNHADADCEVDCASRVARRARIDSVLSATTRGEYLALTR